MAGGLLGFAADTGGIDEPPPRSLDVDEFINRVDRRPCDIVDDHSLATGQLVQQRRLADIGTPEQCNPTGTAVTTDPLPGLGEHGDQNVQQVSGATTVQGGRGERLAQPQGPQRCGREFGVRIVGLVRHHQHRNVCPLQDARDFGVRIGRSDGRVENERDGVRFGECALSLPRDLRTQAACARVPPAGVHHQEVLAVPFGVVRDPIPRDARDVLDNCLTSTEDSIDQGGFPDIGSANDGEGGKLGGASNPLHVRQLSVDISELRTGGRPGGLSQCRILAGVSRRHRGFIDLPHRDGVVVELLASRRRRAVTAHDGSRESTSIWRAHSPAARALMRETRSVLKCCGNARSSPIVSTIGDLRAGGSVGRFVSGAATCTGTTGAWLRAKTYPRSSTPIAHTASPEPTRVIARFTISTPIFVTGMAKSPVTDSNGPGTAAGPSAHT